jgi:hypothetical protein
MAIAAKNENTSYINKPGKKKQSQDKRKKKSNQALKENHNNKNPRSANYWA